MKVQPSRLIRRKLAENLELLNVVLFDQFDFKLLMFAECALQSNFSSCKKTWKK